MQPTRLYPISLALTVTLAAAACAPAGTATQASTTAHAVSVDVATPTRGDIVRVFNSVATLEAWQEVTVYAKASGYLKDIRVDVGDRVEAGDLLATLEIPEMKGQMAMVVAEAVKEKRTLDRLLAIQREAHSAVTQQEIDVARAELQAAEAHAHQLEAESGYASITAPFAGIITERMIHPGALVTAGTQSKPTAIVRLVDDQKLRAVVAVPESDFRFVQQGNAARLRLDAYPDRLFEGRVSRRAGALDATTRTMRTEILLDNSERDLVSGMFAHVALDMETRRDALTVKPGWVHHRKQQRFVFIVDGKLAKMVEITTGADDGNLIEILGGLAGDEHIIAAAAGRLRDGILVAIRGETETN